MKIKIIKFNNFYDYPTRKHYNDAGADCYIPMDITIGPAETKAVGLGFGACIPDGYAGFLIIRSGCAKKGLTVALSPIDSSYRGEIHAIITNTTKEEIKINKGDRVGQLVIMPIVIADFVEELGEERGVGAFNSTGR